MMSTSLYRETFRLKDNPFSTVPPGKVRPIVWAARDELKQKLIETIRDSFITSPSRIIINWGEWGAGKTHAMGYFSREGRLSSIAAEINAKKGFSIAVTCPRSNVIEALYMSVIESIGFDRIKSIVKAIFEEEQITGETEQMKQLRAMGFNHVAARAILSLLSSESDIRATAERYLYLEATRSDLKIIDVPRRIRSSIDMLNMLSQFIKLLSTERSPYSRVFLWVDEVETINDFSGKDLNDFRFFFRDILDLVPDRFTIFLNLTIKDLEEKWGYLSPAILERVYTIVKFPVLEKEEAVNYVNELLNSSVYRDKRDMELLKKEKGALFPFTESAIVRTFELLTEHLKRSPTPRNLNDALSATLDLALRNEKLVQQLQTLQAAIDHSFVKSSWPRIRIGVI